MPLSGNFPARWPKGRNTRKTYPYPPPHEPTPTIPTKHKPHTNGILPLLPTPRTYVALSQKIT